MNVEDIIKVNSINTLPQAAEQLLEACKDRNFFAFYGTLGAGKTTFIKAICKALQSTDEVTSPTYTLVNEYETANGHPIFHIDLYRLDSIDEAMDIGIEDYLYTPNATCLIEWPQIIEPLLPDDTVTVSLLKNDDDSREIKIAY